MVDSRIDTRILPIQFSADHTKVGIGKTPTNGALDVAGDIYSNGKKVVVVQDTDWQDFSWVNPTYIGTTQSSYNRNQWRVKNDTLHIAVGAGATSTINTSAEIEIARIPITGSGLDASSNRLWTMGVGGAGAYLGFILSQNATYMSVFIKPHVTTSGQTAPWGSGHFTYPLDDGYIIS